MFFFLSFRDIISENIYRDKNYLIILLKNYNDL